MKTTKYYLFTLLIAMLRLDSAEIPAPSSEAAFPFVLPKKKPDRPLSASMERLYTDYMAATPESNELYTQFKYTELKGFDYHGGDGTVSRRDPSKIIFENGKYYIWFTKRATPTPPKGKEYTDTIPSADWDLAEVWYATSKDGFTWKEEGVAIPRPPKPYPGWRAVCTPGILKWKGKFYLYYQAFLEASGTRGDDCPIAASYADSPEGPWTPVNQIILPTGAKGEWDQYAVQDPRPLVHDGKIYMYYKSDSDADPGLVRMQGLAIAEDPLGPYIKHPLNPVLSSSHEIALFPFKQGVAVLVIRDGMEHFTIQYAEDWVNFKIAAITELMPTAAGLFVPDAFTDTKYGRGVTWGLSHFKNVTGSWNTYHSVLTRFDCDLSLDSNDPEMKKHCYYESPEFYYLHGLSKKERQTIEQENQILMERNK
ncbi:MAG: family 43 glycosylhydrolase [Lacunisphaera sp.]|nr:family 43 glycosylhydrolase [Lacunisphaera sp.]